MQVGLDRAGLRLKILSKFDNSGLETFVVNFFIDPEDAIVPD